MKNIAVIAVAVTLVTLVHNYEAKANEQTNPIINTIENIKFGAVNNKVTDFVKQEWSETKEYQKNSWAEGQEQLARNKQQIVGYWDTVAEAWGYYFQPKVTND